LLLIVGLLFIACPSWAQESTSDVVPSFTDEELKAMVARIALYPDPLLAQVLPAATYPLEIVEAARLIRDKSDHDKIDKQDWDPSVKAVARYPSVLKMMSDDLDWTEQLGQAVIGQQEDVMQAVQVMRAQAEKVGHLKTTKQQIVTRSDKVIEIVPATPEVIYVPVYDPTVVYVLPVRHYYHPVIRFGVAFPIGSWLNIGFYWSSWGIYHCDPYWWHGGWHHHYHHHYYSHHHYDHHYATNITHITNINNYYSKKTVKVASYKQYQKKDWRHDNRHGTPYSGRKAYSQNTSRPNPDTFGRYTNNKSKTESTQNVRTSPQTTDRSKATTRTTQKDNERNFEQAMNRVKQRDKTPAGQTTPSRESSAKKDQGRVAKAQERTHSYKPKINSRYKAPPTETSRVSTKSTKSTTSTRSSHESTASHSSSTKPRSSSFSSPSSSSSSYRSRISSSHAPSLPKRYSSKSTHRK